MTILHVLKYPHPRLRAVSDPVQEVTDEVKRLADDLAETMYALNGAGLAAPQVGVHQRVFVTDTAEDAGGPADLRVFVNPRIVAYSQDSVPQLEGCLSFPGVHEIVSRSSSITVWALDREGTPFSLALDGLLAVAFQHELDHLNGALFIDRLSAFVKNRVERIMRKRGRA